MNFPSASLRLFLRRFLLLLGVYSLLRLGFYLFNFRAFPDAGAEALFWAFGKGLR